MFGNKQEKADLMATAKEMRSDMDRLKLRLFGSGNTNCLNVSTSDETNSILGGHRNRIKELEETVQDLMGVVESLKPKKKVVKKTTKKKR